MTKVKTINERAKAYAIRTDADHNGDAANDYKAGYRQALKDMYKVVYGVDGDEALNAVERFLVEIGASSCRVPP